MIQEIIYVSPKGFYNFSYFRIYWWIIDKAKDRERYIHKHKNFIKIKNLKVNRNVIGIIVIGGQVLSHFW